MRLARDLDEAQEILARYRPIGCWTYLIADGRKREVLCWEEDPRRQRPIRVRAPQITFGYANIYLDQALGQHETSLYGGYWRNNLQRHRRANALLEQGLGQHTPQTIAHILGDTGERCRLNEGIASLITVASVVMRPEDGVVWLGTGRAPTCRGTFIAFDLSKRDYAPEHGTLTVGEPQPTPADQAFAELGQAYLAYIDQNDVAAAWAALQRACALAPAQPLYFHLSGLLALHNQAFAAALTAFDRAAALDHPDPVRQSSIFLWRGRSHDLVGQRAKAVADYQACLDREPDVQVERAARAGLRRAFLPKQCRRLKLDLIYGDAVFV
jgi:tetratricopeptide (TPR) repeat protein